MKEQIREVKFKGWRGDILQEILPIIEHYGEMDLNMTLRQLYYQLVTYELINNNMNMYKRIGVLVNDARYSGIIDWEAIEDRGRISNRHAQWKDIKDLMTSAKRSFRKDRWRGQDCRVELLSEKDAISNILEPIANKYHIYFTANKGYSSSSSLYRLAKRIDVNWDVHRCKTMILYLGDHDPSGLDMDRDIQERVSEFVNVGPETCYFKRIAITKDQIEKYNPPPNPAKMTDTRAINYIKEHGRVSWEVDAIKPEIMQEIVENYILECLDKEMMDDVIQEEKDEIGPLMDIVNKM